MAPLQCKPTPSPRNNAMQATTVALRFKPVQAVDRPPRQGRGRKLQQVLLPGYGKCTGGHSREADSTARHTSIRWPSAPPFISTIYLPNCSVCTEQFRSCSCRNSFAGPCLVKTPATLCFLSSETGLFMQHATIFFNFKHITESGVFFFSFWSVLLPFSMHAHMVQDQPVVFPRD